MTIKTCVTCKWHEIATVPLQDGQWGRFPACNNVEKVCDPVTGQKLVCESARSNEFFCGLEGKHWEEKEKEEEDKQTSLVLTH